MRHAAKKQNKKKKNPGDKVQRMKGGEKKGRKESGGNETQHKRVKLRENWVEGSERGEVEKVRMRVGGEETGRDCRGEKKVEKSVRTKKGRMRTAGQGGREVGGGEGGRVTQKKEGDLTLRVDRCKEGGVGGGTLRQR